MVNPATIAFLRSFVPWGSAAFKIHTKPTPRVPSPPPPCAGLDKSAGRAISAGCRFPGFSRSSPTRRKEPFDHADWLFDVKYDGFRALCHIEQGRCRLMSRNGKPGSP
jgi:hypothetical protein